MSHSALYDILKSEDYALALSPGFFCFYGLVGALHALEDADCLRATHVSGSSAGAMVGGFLASGLKPSEMVNKVFSIRREDIWDMGGIGGLLRGQLFQQLLESHLPVGKIEDCRIPLGISVMTLLTFQTKCLTQGDLATAIRASCCFPLLFQPVSIDGVLCIDGGLWDDAGLMALPGVPSSSKLIVNIVCGNERKSSSRLPEKFSQDKDTRLLTILLEGLPSVNPLSMDSMGPEAYRVARDSFRSALFEGCHIQQLGQRHWCASIDCHDHRFPDPAKSLRYQPPPSLFLPPLTQTSGSFKVKFNNDESTSSTSSSSSTNPISLSSTENDDESTSISTSTPSQPLFPHPLQFVSLSISSSQKNNLKKRVRPDEVEKTNEEGKDEEKIEDENFQQDSDSHFGNEEGLDQGVEGDQVRTQDTAVSTSMISSSSSETGTFSSIPSPPSILPPPSTLIPPSPKPNIIKRQLFSPKLLKLANQFLPRSLPEIWITFSECELREIYGERVCSSFEEKSFKPLSLGIFSPPPVSSIHHFGGAGGGGGGGEMSFQDDEKEEDFEKLSLAVLVSWRDVISAKIEEFRVRDPLLFSPTKPKTADLMPHSHDPFFTPNKKTKRESFPSSTPSLEAGMISTSLVSHRSYGWLRGVPIGGDESLSPEEISRGCTHKMKVRVNGSLRGLLKRGYLAQGNEFERKALIQSFDQDSEEEDVEEKTNEEEEEEEERKKGKKSSLDPEEIEEIERKRIEKKIDTSLLDSMSDGFDVVLSCSLNRNNYYNPKSRSKSIPSSGVWVWTKKI